MTAATSSASTGLPRIADAAAPTARIGVRGSASSPRVADNKRVTSWAGPRTAPTPGRSARSRTRRRHNDSTGSAARGNAPPVSRAYTTSGSTACHAVIGCGSGSGSPSTPRAVNTPPTMAVAAEAFTGSNHRLSPI